jgi:ADP-heptose:LPS heptosyltransferase
MRIVVLRDLGLGDLLTGVPALRGLRRSFPSAHLSLVAPTAVADVALLSGAVDSVVSSVPDRPDLAIDLHGRGPQSTRRLLRSRPGSLIAFCHPEVAATRGMPRWTASEHEVARWCRLLASCGVPADPADLLLPRPAVSSPCPGAVVIHPGAAFPARRWPAARWAAVTRALASDAPPADVAAAGVAAAGVPLAGVSPAGRRRPVVVTGTEGERALALDVAAAAGLPLDNVLAGRTSLLELASLVAHASLVLSGDTGIAHLAAAYATPSVTLMGPVPPRLWGLPRRPWHRVLWKGHYGDPHGTVPDPGLLAITPAEVLRSLPLPFPAHSLPHPARPHPLTPPPPAYTARNFDI